MKPVAIVATQLLLALTVFALGIAALALPDELSAQLTRLGVGEGARLAIGTLQMIAGACLMVPRGHVAGAAILVAITIGLAVFVGVQTVGEASAARRDRVRIDAAVAGTCGARPTIVARSEWKI